MYIYDLKMISWTIDAFDALTKSQSSYLLF